MDRLLVFHTRDTLAQFFRLTALHVTADPSGTPRWTLDLGPNNYTIDATDFAGNYQGMSNAVTSWTVEYSDDNSTWTTAVANWNPGGSRGTFTNVSFTPVVGKRYWRFTMNSNSCPNGCWVDDFGLWGW